MVEHIRVDKANYAHALSFQVGGSANVIGLALAMRVPVEFYDQAAPGAVEVRDVAPEANLPAELEAVQLPVAEASPELLLGRRRFVTHGAGAIEELRIDLVRTERHGRFDGCPSP